jgi:hypothetical protein
MRTILHGLLAAAFVFGSISATAVAEEPTYGETTAWIGQKVVQEFQQFHVTAAGTDYIGGSSGGAHWDGCKLHLWTVWASLHHPLERGTAHDVSIRVYSEYTIPLAYLDESEISRVGAKDQNPEVWRLTIKTATLQKVIASRWKMQLKTNDEGTWSEGNVNSFSLHFTDRGLAERVGHAFKHLSNLCGAPKEPF